MKKILLFALLLLAFPTIAYAKIGVGVGTGKIQVRDELKPGVIYNLPPLTIINTGDQPSEYEVMTAYHEKQKELVPPESWFIFSPKKFSLKPGEVKTVEVKLNLPLSIEPGEYFAYLEGHPIEKTKVGQTSVGIAAATKLYFTVVPGNFIEGIYYKLLSIWKVYFPIPQIILGILVFVALIILFKKYFNIQINVKNNEPHEKKKPSGNEKSKGEEDTKR